MELIRFIGFHVDKRTESKNYPLPNFIYPTEAEEAEVGYSPNDLETNRIINCAPTGSLKLNSNGCVCL